VVRARDDARPHAFGDPDLVDEVADGRLRELGRALDRLFRAGRDENKSPEADFDEARRLATLCIHVVGRPALLAALYAQLTVLEHDEGSRQ
jgi:hypothetical protein